MSRLRALPALLAACLTVPVIPSRAQSPACFTSKWTAGSK